jgi:hypothetical protein
MRWVLVALLAGVLAFSGEGVADAAKDKVPCKKIKHALASGKKPDEVATELGVSAQRVEHCMNKKGKGGAAGATGATGAAAGADDDDSED